MKKPAKRQIAMVAGILILLVYWLSDSGLHLLIDVVKKGDSAFKNTDDTEISVHEDIRKYTDVAALQKLDWTGSWNEDPFFYVSADMLQRPSGLIGELFGLKDKLKTAGLELRGISWHGNSGMALINGTVLREGEVVAGHTVERIGMKYVTLTQGRQSIRLNLNENE